MKEVRFAIPEPKSPKVETALREASVNAAANEAAAVAMATEASKQLLANAVMEYFEVVVL